jgi:hypothetical protein
MHSDALTRMNALLTGAANTLTVQLAPFIESAIAKVVALGSAGEGMGAKVVGAFEWVLKSMAWASDSFSLLESCFHSLRDAANIVLMGITKAFQYTFGTALEVAGATFETLGVDSIAGPIKETTKFIENLGDGFHDIAKESAIASANALQAYEDGTAQKKVAAFFKGIRKEAKTNAAKVAADMADTNAGMGFKLPEQADRKRPGEVGDTFKQMSLRRFSIAGFAGMQQRKEEQQVKSRGIEQRLDRLIDIASQQKGFALS